MTLCPLSEATQIVGHTVALEKISVALICANSEPFAPLPPLLLSSQQTKRLELQVLVKQLLLGWLFGRGNWCSNQKSRTKPREGFLTVRDHLNTNMPVDKTESVHNAVAIASLYYIYIEGFRPEWHISTIYHACLFKDIIPHIADTIPQAHQKSATRRCARFRLTHGICVRNCVTQPWSPGPASNLTWKRSTSDGSGMFFACTIVTCPGVRCTVSLHAA